MKELRIIFKKRKTIFVSDWLKMSNVRIYHILKSYEIARKNGFTHDIEYR